MMILVEIHLSDADLAEPMSQYLGATLDSMAFHADDIRLHLWAISKIPDEARHTLLKLIETVKLRDKRISFVDVSPIAAAALGISGGEAPPIGVFI